MKQYQFMKDTDDNGNETVNVTYKPKRRLDLFARLACLLVALVIWLGMVNINETDVTETMVLKIEYVGLEDLENEGMMIYGMDKAEVTVTIKGSNRDIKKHDPEDYSVVADVSGLDEAGAYTLPLVVKIPSDSGATVESDSSLNVSLLCDLSAEKYVDFDVLVSSTQDGGLITYAYESEQSESEVLIKGPKQIIDMISSARFNANGNFVANADERTYANFPLTFLDKNLNEVNDGGAVEYTTEDFEVKVSAIAHKSIPVEVKVLGSGTGLVKSVSTDSVEIWGAPSVIRNIKSYPIVITNAYAGMVRQHELTSDMLAEGVSVKESVIITVSFEDLIKDEE
jgi:hypothetical protein